MSKVILIIQAGEKIVLEDGIIMLSESDEKLARSCACAELIKNHLDEFNDIWNKIRDEMLKDAKQYYKELKTGESTIRRKRG